MTCLSCDRPSSGLYCDTCREPETVAKTEPAKPKRTPRDRMNKTEARWHTGDILPRLRSGALIWCEHEALKLRVGMERTWYTPDYAALRSDGTLEITEVKGGYIHEDARVKFQAAARLYPWMHWRMVQWVRGSWRTVYDYPAEGARARAA